MGTGCCGWGVISLVYSVERFELDIEASDYTHATQVGKIIREFSDMVEKECSLPMGKVREYVEEAIEANALAKEAHDKVEIVAEPQHSDAAKRNIRLAIFELENTLKNTCLAEAVKETAIARENGG